MLLSEYLAYVDHAASINRSFYHFTDKRNLGSIRRHGLLSLKELKRRGIVPLVPSGNDWSHEADERIGADHYVHLCLKDRHPMEYAARQRIDGYEAVYLKVDFSVLQQDGIKMTTEVANKSGVDFLNINDGLKLLDLEVLYRRTDWTNPDIKTRLKAAEKCEILIPDHVDVSKILNL